MCYHVRFWSSEWHCDAQGNGNGKQIKQLNDSDRQMRSSEETEAALIYSLTPPSILDNETVLVFSYIELNSGSVAKRGSLSELTVTGRVGVQKG